jgi:hypothetical protein
MSSHSEKKTQKRANNTITAFTRLDRAEITTRKFILHNAAGIASDGAGTMSGVISLDPSAAQDWSIIANYYDEFRVIAVRLHIVSLQQFSVTAANGLIVILMDNDSSTVQTYVNALQYANKRWSPAIFAHTNGMTHNLLFQRPVNLQSPIDWIDVATPASSLGTIQFISSPASLGLGLNYFNVGVEYMVEARGRR